jgi:quercetin dioxygenase-like cupin family protein
MVEHHTEEARMKVLRNNPSELQPVSGGIFRGSVKRRALVGDQISNQLTIGLVDFDAGGRNIFHTHTYDQVLVITSGEGIVATENEELHVHAGDLVVIPAGEKHWHGATSTTAMAHYAIGTPGTTAAAE